MKKHTYWVNSLTVNSRKCKLVYRARKQINACLGLRTTMGGLQKGTRNLLVVMDIFIILIVVTISWICTYVKIYPILYFKYVQFIAFQFNLNKVLSKRII